MLIPTSDITKRYLDGLNYLANISTRKFNLNRYGVQTPFTDADNSLLLLTYALQGWKNQEGATNAYTETQMLGIMENIQRVGRDCMAQLGCTAEKGATVASTPSTGGGGSTPPTPVVKIEIRWDYFEDDPGDPRDATLVRTFKITHGANYTVPTTSVNFLNWFIIEEPSSEPVKTHWFNTELNKGTIPDQVWNTPVEAAGKRYYLSRGPQAFNPIAGVKFSTA